MASAVDICNLALGHIGDKANVASISPPEATVQAEQCAKFYPIARDLLQEMHAWSFNTRRASLAAVTNVLDSWAFAYALPGDCVKPLSILPPGVTDDKIVYHYALETEADGSKIIYTNVEDATLRYLVRVTDTTKFTPGFVVALSWLLASYLAGPIIKGKSGTAVAREAMRTFDAHFGAASSSDANASTDDQYADHKPKWVTDR